MNTNTAVIEQYTEEQREQIMHESCNRALQGLDAILEDIFAETEAGE